MILSHRIRIDATVKQQRYFAQACGTARFVWNWALEHWNSEYDAGGKPCGHGLKRQFNQSKYELYPWLAGIHRDAHSQPFATLQKAFAAFFKGSAKRPRFHKKGRRDSFYCANDTLRYVAGEKAIRLPVIGSVRLREALRLTGKIMSATVSRTADKWFISIQVEVGEYRKPRVGNGVVGVDLGLNVTAMCSDGQRLIGPKALKAGLKKLRRASRRNSRKQNGSQNRKKASMRLARIHAKIANVRNDWLHKATTKLASENQAVFFEKLGVANMLKNRSLSRAISDAGWSRMARQAEYKSVIYGGLFHQIDRWEPSSKTCRKCGQIKKDLKLSDRVFLCDGCGHEEDRDLNASHNICTAGLAGIYAHGPEGSGSRRKTNAKPCRVEVRTKPCPYGTP